MHCCSFRKLLLWCLPCWHWLIAVIDGWLTCCSPWVANIGEMQQPMLLISKILALNAKDKRSQTSNHGCIKRTGYGAATKPCCGSFLVDIYDIAEKKIPCSFRAVDTKTHLYAKTVDRTWQTANKVNYHSLYDQLLIHERYIFVNV